MRIGRLQIGGKFAPQNVPVVQRFVHRTESGACKNGARLARRDVCRSSFAIVRNDRSEPNATAQNARGIRESKMKSPVRVTLIGARGRMGQTIVDLARNDPKIEIVAQCDLGDAIEPRIKNCDVAIDFSNSSVIDEISRVALQYRKALVIGTTGHSREQREVMERAAKSLPIVFASNFSVGVNALFALSRRAAEILGSEFAPRIVETHHKMKKDAPRGRRRRWARF